MPDGNNIRPTPGKVKEAIFSMVGHDLTDNLVLDLFAGTGSLGMEAISRGASYVWLSDKSIEACQLISENIKLAGAGEKAKLIRGEWQQVLEHLSKAGQKLDVIFLDPPYEAGILESTISTISDYKLLNPEGIIVAEHDHRLVLPDRIGEFILYKHKKYGHTDLSLYGYEDGETE